jgi:endonuclease G
MMMRQYPVTEAASITIVISEVQTRGSAGATDEFVELYNLSANAVDISGYKLYYRAKDGSISYTRHIVPSGITLQPYQHYLIVGSGYDGGVTNDGTLTSSIADVGGLQLQTGGGTVVDSLAYSYSGGGDPNNGFAEGAYFNSNPHDNSDSTNQDTSMERKPGTLSSFGGHKNGTDTDDNSNDFFTTTTSNPENLSSPTVITLCTLTAKTASPNPLAALPVLGLVALGGLAAVAALGIGAGLVRRRRG